MTTADRTFNIVINKEALDCIMCSSYQIKRRMNIYRDKVGRVLRLGDPEDYDGKSYNNKGGEGKGGTMTTPLTKKMRRGRTRRSRK